MLQVHRVQTLIGCVKCESFQMKTTFVTPSSAGEVNPEQERIGIVFVGLDFQVSLVVAITPELVRFSGCMESRAAWSGIYASVHFHHSC